MAKPKKAGNRMIAVKGGLVGPVPARPRSVKVKQVGDYPGVPSAYIEVCDNYSKGLEGPPICDELVALVQHMFTDEEASVIRHLKPLSMLTADRVAQAAGRPVEEVRGILDRLADDLHIIASLGPAGAKSYMGLPILPGAFEMVLVRQSMDTLTDWHRRFAELFEALYKTGFMMDGVGKMPPAIRYLPVGGVIDAHPMALPSDLLEEVVDQYDSFAVGLCQCRMTEQIVGRGCGRPMDNCTAMGAMADMAVRAGQMRKVEKKELLEIKHEAEAAGLINWAMNQSMMPGSSAICSCCGCCCLALRMISEFNMPGSIAPPHFMPEVDPDQCDYCAKCARACPMGAITIDMKGKTREFESVRCVGCGQCMVACDEKKAVRLEPVEGYQPPKILG
jgi:NAD-dependent dihydropyrimidine dehydrogenase PreA subunit